MTTVVSARHPAVADVLHWMFRREWTGESENIQATPEEIDRAERALGGLTLEEREAFGIGDEATVDSIAKRNSELAWVDEWLNRVYDCWFFPPTKETK